MNGERLKEIQSRLTQLGLDGWLFFDHHLRDPIAYRVLGLTPPSHVSRRWYYFIPATGSARKLVHRVESKILDLLPGQQSEYSRWQEHAQGIERLLINAKRVAMQYSPLCAIPYVAMVDAGTIELVRSTGADVVSSAELVQYFEARLDETARESHFQAGVLIDRIRAEAFQWIGDRVRIGDLPTEFAAAEFIRLRFAESGLVTNSGPIVGVNQNSSDPHYEPSERGSCPIQKGDFVLLDMWAKLNRPGAIYYDITWTGVLSDTVPENVAHVFEMVSGARDAAAQFAIDAVARGAEPRGYQVDDAAREVIGAAGFGDRFVHRTGHSIGTEVHGNGANMDNLETHDDRKIIPWSCFSVEPGVYLESFGIRSELNVFVDEKSARVTGETQDRLVRIV